MTYRQTFKHCPHKTNQGEMKPFKCGKNGEICSSENCKGRLHCGDRESEINH